jgi:phosphatidylglycerol lysyltransferase
LTDVTRHDNTVSLPAALTPTRPPLVAAHAPPASSAVLQHARALVMSYGWNTTAYQLLNPGMSLWFAPAGDAVVGYVAAQGYRIVAGAPVCAPQRLAAVAATFEEETRRAGQRVCYFAAQDRMVMALDTRRPLAALLLGAQPAWRPQHWAARIARKASLRAQLARARNKQVSVAWWAPEQATNHPALLRCLNHWLHTRRMPPLHFLTEADTLGVLDDRQVWVAQRDKQVVGFLVASPIPRRDGWLIEQVIRGAGAPNGTTELLLDTAMRDLAAAGAAFATLGLAPLSERAGMAQSPQPLWLRLVLAWVRAHGQRFYNFAGLDAFKAKFLPEWWEPVYAISREPQVSFRTLYAIAGAFSSTLPLAYVGRGLGWALAQEARHMRQRTRQALARG